MVAAYFSWKWTLAELHIFFKSRSGSSDGPGEKDAGGEVPAAASPTSFTFGSINRRERPLRLLSDPVGNADVVDDDEFWQCSNCPIRTRIQKEFCIGNPLSSIIAPVSFRPRKSAPCSRDDKLLGVTNLMINSVLFILMHSGCGSPRKGCGSHVPNEPRRLSQRNNDFSMKFFFGGSLSSAASAETENFGFLFPTTTSSNPT